MGNSLYSYRGQRRIILDFSVSRSLGQGLILSWKSVLSTQLASQQASEICPSLMSSSGIIDTSAMPGGFSWVLEVQTQVLLLTSKLFLPTEPSPHPLRMNGRASICILQ